MKLLAHAIAVTLLLAGAGGVRAGDDLAQAREYTDARDYPAALRIFDVLHATKPGDADLAIERARVLGFADRNADSARAYAEVARLHPDRRHDVLASWAWQTLWGGDAQGAVPLFREVLEANPNDGTARMGLAQAQLWSGESLAASRTYAQLLPTDDEALQVQAARAFYWAGFPDRAEPLLDDAASPGAMHLRDFRVRRETAERFFSAGLDYSTDADDLDITALWASGGWRPTARDTLEASLRHATYDGPDTSTWPYEHHRVDATQALVAWSGRFGDYTSPRGVLWPMVAVGGRDVDGWTAFSWRGRLRYVASDMLTLSAYAGNGVPETVGAARNRIEYTEVSTGAEVRPDPHWRASANLAQIGYDRGNDRAQLSGAVDYLLEPKQQWRVGVDAVYFTNSGPDGPNNPNVGYWNPDRYGEVRAFTSVAADHGPWSYEARGSLGYFNERDGWGTTTTDPTFALSGAVAYDISPRWQVRGYAGGSSSSSGLGSGGDGYHRTWVGVSVTGWF